VGREARGEHRTSNIEAGDKPIEDENENEDEKSNAFEEEEEEDRDGS
jgi:hypothetical protein